MCMVDGADGTNFEPKSRRARKPHRCDECFRSIEVGETYHLSTGVVDGSIYGSKTCAHCWAGPCAWLVKHCHGYLLEGVSEDILEHWQNPPPGHDIPRFEVGRLLVSMRRKWKRPDGSSMPIPMVAT